MDLAATQLPLLAGAAITWLAAHFALANVQGVELIATTLIVSYSASALCLALLPSGRQTLQDAATLATPKLTKVFWFFFSKKNTFLLSSPSP
jgi:hypothetical protein